MCSGSGGGAAGDEALGRFSDFYSVPPHGSIGWWDSERGQCMRMSLRGAQRISGTEVRVLSPPRLRSVKVMVDNANL